MAIKQTLWGIIKTVSLFTTVAFIGFLLAGKLEFSTKKIVAPVDCNQVRMDYHAKGTYPLIDGFQLRQMASHYQNPIDSTITWTRGPVTSSWKVNNSTSRGLRDTHSAWFSLEDLKYFLWEIETKVCKNPCMKLTSDKLGVRIYFGRYPNGSQVLNGLPPEYENRQTVFMIPTFDGENSNSIHYDFLLDSTIMSNSCTPIPVPFEKNLLHYTVRTFLLPNGKNHGTLCPPECDGSVF